MFALLQTTFTFWPDGAAYLYIQTLVFWWRLNWKIAPYTIRKWINCSVANHITHWPVLLTDVFDWMKLFSCFIASVSSDFVNELMDERQRQHLSFSLNKIHPRAHFLWNSGKKIIEKYIKSFNEREVGNISCIIVDRMKDGNCFWNLT